LYDISTMLIREVLTKQREISQLKAEIAQTKARCVARIELA
jgi:hypothetical protein